MSFEQLKNIIDANKVQAEIDREIERNPTECPDDAWPLSVNKRGEKSCPICGRVWR
jgi:uncharacterized Zn finger protein (UPF0148 family)